MSNIEDRNVAARLSRTARLTPSALAIAQPIGRARQDGSRDYSAETFEQLDARSQQIARGLIHAGMDPGMRIVLAVPFGADFIRLTFALLRCGAVPVLVDPGMGRKNIVECLRQVKPDGFLAIPKAHLLRVLMRSKFPSAKLNITVGRKFGWGGYTLNQIEKLGEQDASLPTRADSDDAAVIFTTGSTGPPKGVRYTHGIFNHQIDLIRSRYGIRPGSRDLACFPLFGLFDAVMGVSTIIPDMDPTRPADVNPRRILEAVDQWEIDQAFGSPALWDSVSRWCMQTGNRLGSLRRIMSAGAPVPPRVLRALRQITDDSIEIFTPYGATESLPIASIESRVVLEETAPRTEQGLGTCVGTRFESIHWRVIEITDEPIASIADTKEVPPGTIGELMVRGPVVTQQYVTREDQNALHKVKDGDTCWHRMGDVGYLDEQDRFWFCGRKSHRVITEAETLFTVPCEAIFNTHPLVARSALVGVPFDSDKTPVIVVEMSLEFDREDTTAAARVLEELRQLAKSNKKTQSIRHFLVHPRRLPVDIRHNSKIFREQLSGWAKEQLNT